MKPKKVICPICGRRMVAESWGSHRRVYMEFTAEPAIGGDILNNVVYICSCGCEIKYEGTESCWEFKEI